MKTVNFISIIVLSMKIVTMAEDFSTQDAEVFDENPKITKEQAYAWSHEFFRAPRSSNPSGISELNENIDDSENDRRSDRGYNHPGPTKRYRVNTRQYDFPSANANSLSEDAPIVKFENLEWMLQKVFIYPRSHVTNETAKELIKNYISDSFQLTSGLHTSVQHFMPLQFLGMYEGQSLPTGANIIAVIKGTEWSTPNDRPIVIGAHWDTVNFTPGTDDNGSGVASMLEAARVISHSGCRPKYSIIFVAFDLEEVGSQGSLVFIKDYLMKILQTNLPTEVTSSKFQGAFIMDTIMNFNASEGSQTFPTDWSLVVPDVYEEVANENYVGDFLSMIYRKDVDFKMAEKFRLHWGKSNHDAKYKLKEFPLILKADLPEMEVLSDHLNFLRSDHARFWYMNDTEIPFTLNAMLMTDTGPYRGNMRACYHTVCDGPEVTVYNYPDNLKFLAKITQALVDTTIDMSECKVQENVRKRESPNNDIDSITRKINAVNTASRRISSPLRNLVNILKWMQKSYSAS